MKRFLVTGLGCILLSAGIAAAAASWDTYNGMWQCDRELMLTEDIEFTVSIIANVSLEQRSVSSSGVMKATSTEVPFLESILELSSVEAISINNLELTSTPLSTEAKLLKDELKIFSDEFINSLVNNDVATTTKMLIKSEREIHFQGDTGAPVVCLRINLP